MNFHPLCRLLPPIEDEEFESLVKSIEANGLRHKIILFGGEILDGRHRYLACQKIGIAPQFETFDGNDNDAKAFVLDQNLERRHLTEGQRAAVVEDVANWSRGGDRQSPRVDFASKVTVADAAKRGGVSRSTIFNVRKAKREGAPEVFAAIKSGAASPTDAARIADAPHEDQVEALNRVLTGKAQTMTSAIHIMRNERMSEETMPALPTGEYRVVVIDPPWPIEYNYKSMEHKLKVSGPEYPVMSLDAIKEIKLPLADDAFVFLWFIQQFRHDVKDVMDAWGVEPLYTMAWVKNQGMKSVGGPYHTLEFIEVGRRGKPEYRTTKGLKTHIEAPRGADSEKPEAFYELLRRVTVGPRIDMYNRRKIDGFTGWGQEAQQ